MDEDAEATTVPKHEITLVEEALELPNGTVTQYGLHFDVLGTCGSRPFFATSYVHVLAVANTCMNMRQA